MRAIEEGIEMTGLEGVAVELTVPRGKEIAILTLNPKLGVAGGISILGSTGFVEPWNDHLAMSRNEEIKGLRKVLVTTGRTGLKYSQILPQITRLSSLAAILTGFSSMRGRTASSAACPPSYSGGPGRRFWMIQATALLLRWLRENRNIRASTLPLKRQERGSPSHG